MATTTDDKKPEVKAAVPNGNPAPPFDLPFAEELKVITANILKLTELIQDP
jgi:hypothetical protein